MFVTVVSSGEKLPVIIEEVADSDYKILTKKRYSFNWKLEKTNCVYKLRVSNEEDIIGLISLQFIDSEMRLSIN